MVNLPFLVTIFATIMLFLSGALILPNHNPKNKTSLIDYFHENGRYAVLVISLYLFSCVIINILQGQLLFSEANIFNFILAPLGILTYSIPNRKFQFISTLVFVIMTLIAFMIGVWTFF